LKVGRRSSDGTTAEEIAQVTGKAQKTVRKTLAQMLRLGLVERAERGSYRITVLGLKELRETMRVLRVTAG